MCTPATSNDLRLTSSPGNRRSHCFRRFEVHENKVEFNLCDSFQVKMTSRVDNFTLDHCLCRISIRKVRVRGEENANVRVIACVSFRKVAAVVRTKRSASTIWI